MTKYKMKIEILTDTLIGSGEGFGTVIDTDIVFDDIGIPYIPSKRMKGLLRDSASSIVDIFKLSFDDFELPKVEDLFGEPGKEWSCPFKISDFYISDYNDNYNWLNYFLSKDLYKNFISGDLIIDYFTNIRKSTTIENGVAKRHSLRSFRVLSRGYTFVGEIEINGAESDKIKLEKLLSLSCLNLKSIGTKRNRGLGKIKCQLLNGNNNLGDTTLEELEALCKN